MIGCTAGIAAAANYPAPFVQNGNADVAIVYGANAQASDVVQAGNIQTSLQSYMGSANGGISTSTSGEDSAALWRSTSYITLGHPNVPTDFATSVTKDQLKVLLADGTYNDANNNEYPYTQKIDLGNDLNVTHFSDSDYKDKTPVIGIKLDSGHVLNYTLDFATNVNFSAAAMETTTLKLLGKDYYILDVQHGTTNKTTLLDSANSAIMSDTDTKTLTVGNATYTVTIGFISTNQVKLVVNGETTNTLSAGDTYKLADGTYVGVKDILVQDYAGGVKQVEFSLGKGKLELNNNNKVKVNDKTINELTAYLIQDTTSTYLDKIVISWDTDGKEFIVPGNDLVMPAFEAIKFTMGDWTAPDKEVTKLDPSSDSVSLDTTIYNGDITIPLLQVNSTGQIQVIGRDSNNRLVTSPNNFLFVNKTAGDKYMIT